MPISRRNLLCQLGVGAAVSAALPSLAEIGLGAPRPSPASSGSAGPVILSRNENAYGASEKVVAAMRETVHAANRYPLRQEDELLERVAALHGVKAERIVFGCGSSEILTTAVASFAGPGKKIITASPTFELPGHAGQIEGSEVITVPLNRSFGHDLGGMLAKADASTGLVYICNPNNPTASITPRAEIEDFLQKLPRTTMVLMDEAYHHFVPPTASYASFIDKPVDDDRLIVARTFSKVYGLAGIRVGYAVASPDVAQKLASRCVPASVNLAAAVAAVSALEDQEFVRACVKSNAENRQEFFNQAKARKLAMIDSNANFVMMNAQRPAPQVIEHFKKNGVLIGRPFPPLDNYIRVTLGKSDEMAQFWRVWDLAPARKMEM
jgi:histidinol-phosphate aminotransferase